MTKKSTKMISEIKIVSFIGFTPYKIGQKSNKKLILLT